MVAFAHLDQFKYKILHVGYKCDHKHNIELWSYLLRTISI